MTQPAPNTLEEALGYSFRDPQLLVKALTHSSLAYEQTLEGRQANGTPASREEDNEQLEFLGDAVLGLVVAEILFRRFPDLHEGEWTRLRASLVSRRHLAQVATAVDLGPTSAWAAEKNAEAAAKIHPAGQLRGSNYCCSLSGWWPPGGRSLRQ